MGRVETVERMIPEMEVEILEMQPTKAGHSGSGGKLEMDHKCWDDVKKIRRPRVGVENPSGGRFTSPLPPSCWTPPPPDPQKPRKIRIICKNLQKPRAPSRSPQRVPLGPFGRFLVFCGVLRPPTQKQYKLRCFCLQNLVNYEGLWAGLHTFVAGLRISASKTS